MKTLTVFRGDDTDIWGQSLFTIHLKNSINKKIKRADIICGEIIKTINEPIFPLRFNLNYEESNKLKSINHCFLVLYDELGRKKTYEAGLTIHSKKGAN